MNGNCLQATSQFAQASCSLTAIVNVCALLSLSSFSPFTRAAPGTAPTSDTQDERTCEALTGLNLQPLPGGPAIITSAHILDVPAGGLEHGGSSGYSGITGRRSSSIHRYCDVTGYVAPQSKFELKLPLPTDWNHNFYFNACGGFCGLVRSDLPNYGLERGYASATGNGGHDSEPGFDAVWAANAPELQEDFGWRSKHW